LVRAKNLVVESLQDVLQERLRSLELNIGTQGKLGSKAEVTNRDVAWTRAVGSIIGTQLTNVVVQQTLEIAGGLIANAEVHEDGSLSDKGNAYVEAGTIIAKKLHDYDNGKSFGLGIALNRKTDAKGGSSWGVGMPVVCGFNEKARDILPTIVKGEINITGNSQGGLEFLNHDLNSFIGSTMEEGANLNATLPVSDIVEFVQTIIKPKEQNMPGLLDLGTTGMSAGDNLIEELNTVVLENYEELVKFNPEVQDKQTNYLLKVHYRTIAFKEDKERNISKTISPGHIYYELIDLKTNNHTFFSKYPNQEEGMYNNTIGLAINIVDNKSGKIDKEQHRLIEKHKDNLEIPKEQKETLLFSKVMFLTKNQYDVTSKFASQINDQQFYILGMEDCSDVGRNLFNKLNMPTVYNHLFTKDELKLSAVGKKLNFIYGDRNSPTTVRGNNIEEVANKNNVDVTRVIKKYHIPLTDKVLSVTNTNKNLVLLNRMKDQEYLILPPN